VSLYCGEESWNGELLFIAVDDCCVKKQRVHKSIVSHFHNILFVSQWRSPEEYNYADQTEKGDVWSMGNVLFFLLTGEIPNEAMDYSDAIKHVARGGKPKVNDEAIANTSDPYTLALMTATKACHVVDPKRRPGAKEIAEMMEKAKLAIG
jgi:serine/threonine protein kinase